MSATEAVAGQPGCSQEGDRAPRALTGRAGRPFRGAAAWLPGLIVVGTLIRIPQLWHCLHEMHAFRQTQTAFVALEYARHGIDLLHTPLPVFGPNSDVPMEFPLMQAVAAVLIRMGATADLAMRLVGLAGFQATAILLTVLVLRWHGRPTAIVVLALFEFSPYGLAWGASALIDFPSVALSLGMVVGLDSWFRNGSRIGLVLGAISGWSAFLVKATTPPPWCVLLLASAAAAYLVTRSLRRVITGLLLVGIPGLIAALGWARYGDEVKNSNPLTHFLISGTMHAWNFGSLQQRLTPSAYLPAPFRICTEIAGPFGLGLIVAFCGIALATTKVERIRRSGWLAAAAFAPLMFFNLYFVHSYYLIAIFPAIVASVGIGIVALAQRLRANTAIVAAVATAVVIVGSAAPQNVGQWLIPPKPDSDGTRIAAATGADDLIIVVGCRWDPTILYFADRRGVMLFDANAGGWRPEDAKDYRYLFSCDRSAPATDYLPSDYRMLPTSVPGLFRLAKAQGE